MARDNSNTDRKGRQSAASKLKMVKPKACGFCKEGVQAIDYKDVNLLRKFISDRGKIRSRRVTGLTMQQQRAVAKAIKNAREMALLPYTSSAR